MKEIWKDIPSYEGLYRVSNFGAVKSLSREVFNGQGYYIIPEKILKQRVDKRGYLRVSLSKNGNRKPFKVHWTFLGDRPKEKEILHKDANPQNNCLNNLKYGTRESNMRQTFFDKGEYTNHKNLGLITFNGKTKSMSDWSRSLGGRNELVSLRLRRGWSLEKALTTPVK